MDGVVCGRCGGEMNPGQLGTLKEPQLYFAEATVQSFGRMQMVQPSGPRLPVNAWRCTGCGHVDLWTPVQPVG